MKLSRRQFFKLMGAGSASVLTPRLLLAENSSNNQDDIIISVFLRGAADGLNIVPPYADPDYYRLRPTLGIPSPGKDEGALDLDGFFGLHPGMEALMPVYSAGELAIIHACGSHSPSHSHFEAQDLMERGITNNSNSFKGWLGRYLDYTYTDDFSVFHAVGMGTSAPRCLAHDASTIALSGIDSFSLLVPADEQITTEQMLRQLYDSNSSLDRSSRDTLEAINSLSAADPAQYPPQNDALYPETTFGNQLQGIGQLISANIGLRAAGISLGGWDTHEGEAETLNTQTRELAQALAAFHQDMGERMTGITLVVMTEFGRRAYENGSAGTDHGHASFMMALGKNVNGGKVYRDWPGLKDQDLYGSGDLAVTTDYRDVLGELISKRTAGMPLEELFPEHENPNFSGIFS
jgi:uncharacterized protein (DUF1501 family)